MKQYTTKHGGVCEHPRVQQSGVWKDKSKITNGSLSKHSRDKVKSRQHATIGRISRKVYMSHVEPVREHVPTMLPKGTCVLEYLRSNAG